MSFKQDLNGTRSAQEIERKYDLSSLNSLKKNVQQSEESINKLNRELESFTLETLERIENLQNEIDGNITTYFLSGVPTLSNKPTNEWPESEYNKHLGDLYYDLDTGHAYRFAKQTDDYLWIVITDTDVTEALELASKAQDTADGKRRVFTTTPTVPYDVGDLWLVEEELYVCITSKSSGSFSNADFDKATKYTDDTKANEVALDVNNFVNVTYKEAMNNLTNQIDGKVTTWYYSGSPTLNNAPANTWTTNDEKSKHTGDLYYDKDTGYSYIFAYTNNVYVWERIKDSEITEVLSIANSAKDTADNKRRVFLDTPIPPYDNGDIWVSEGEIYICQISKITGEVFETDDFIASLKYTDDTLASKVNDELTVVKGQVLTIKESTDEYKINFENSIKTINALQKETTEAITNMSYSFTSDDLTIAKSTDPVNARINNQGMKVYSYTDLKLIANHLGVGMQKLIVVGDSQIANLKIVKSTDDNGKACTDFHHLVSNIQTLQDLEV